MTTPPSHLLRMPALWASLALLGSSLMVTGCGIGTSAPDGNSFVQDATVRGQLYGGNTPVVGSTITLYAVGTTGYGKGATELATTTTGSNGAFSFTQSGSMTGPTNPVTATYGCPTNGTLLYLVASSGDPTSKGLIANYNPNIKLLDAIGACSGVASGFYNINEVASVVSVAALQQYLDPYTEQIGSPSTTLTTSNMSAATTGIANAFALVGQILNYGTGTVNATYTPASTVGTVTATPEAAKINTIADVLAACINTTGTSSAACTSLEAAATPPTVLSATNFATDYGKVTAASDTLQALLFMLANPSDAGTQVTTCNGSSTTSNLACLYSLSTATPPFTGVTAIPNDWTVGVTYASTSTQTAGGKTVGYLNYPYYVAVDKMGNVWVSNNVSPGSSTAGNGETELTPTGGISQQVLVNSVIGPLTATIDPSGNVWVPNFGTTSASNTVGYGKSIVEFPANGSAGSVNTYNVAGGPFSIVSDGAGNIFVAETTKAVTNTGGGNGTPGSDIEKIPSGSASGTTGTVISPSTYASYNANSYASMAIDSHFNLWVTNDSTTVMSYAPASPTFTESTTTSGVTDSVGIVVNNSNDVWVSNYASSGAAMDEFTVSGGVISPVTGSPFSSGLGKSTLTAIDGAGNTWTTTDASAGPVFEVAGTGALLGPSTGYIHTYYYPEGIAVDPSGNVWIGCEKSDTATATAAGTNGPGGAAAGGYVTEIIGAAVPVVTPIAAGLPATAGGTSYLATTPQ